jgi:transcriptional regulator with XRE-family HTH domain
MRSIRKLVGARVRILRQEQRLSVADVAGALECDPSSIYSIEKGRHAPSFKRLVALAELLKCDELDLLTFPGEQARHELIELSRDAPVATVAAMKAACQKILEEERHLKSPRNKPGK